MACEIERPSPQAIFDRYLSMFSTTVLGGSPVIPESNEWYVNALNYAVAEEFYAYSEQQWKEQNPQTACCDNLTALAALDGVYPKAATFSSGYGLVTGTVGAALPTALEIIFDGTTYRSVGLEANRIPASGQLNVRFRAIEPGENTNVPPSGFPGANGTARLTVGIEGVDRDVTIYGSTFCGGSDAEECEAFRSRYLARKAFAPRANKAYIEALLLEWPCVTRICQREGTCCTIDSECNGCADCGRNIEYYVFMDNTFECGLAPQCAVEEISAWLFGPPEQQGYGLGIMEVGVCGGIYTATAVGITVRIDGVACLGSSAQAQIEAAITELFRTFCPSSLITIRSFETAIAQVLGNAADFTVSLEVDEDDEANVDQFNGCCGDLELHCDYAACLTEIVFTDSPVKLGCVG